MTDTFRMRTHGVLSKWNDDRGFGFIVPAWGGDELFVHVSAFPRDGVRPRLGELLSFETEVGPNGKPRAVRVMRPGGRTAPGQPRRLQRADHQGRLTGVLGTVFGFLAIIAIGTYGYSRVKDTLAPSPAGLGRVSTINARCAAAGVGCLQVRWPYPVPADDFLCGGHVLRPALPGCRDGRRR